MPARQSLRHWVLFCLAIVVGLVAQGGCKKAPPPPPQEVSAFLTFAGTDVNADGTLSQKTLDTIQSKSGERALGVKFMHTSLTDAGLLQLVPFTNIRHVEAVSSRITDRGIAKLKEAIPELTVAK